tara:strand:- start:13 stop:303 length:291 start_codon:yes stop_codon:yes gene_type:complete
VGGGFENSGNFKYASRILGSSLGSVNRVKFEFPSFPGKLKSNSVISLLFLFAWDDKRGPLFKSTLPPRSEVNIDPTNPLRPSGWDNLSRKSFFKTN